MLDKSDDEIVNTTNESHLRPRELSNDRSHSIKCPKPSTRHQALAPLKNTGGTFTCKLLNPKFLIIILPKVPKIPFGVTPAKIMVE
jgi:hypothetical protein